MLRAIQDFLMPISIKRRGGKEIQHSRESKVIFVTYASEGDSEHLKCCRRSSLVILKRRTMQPVVSSKEEVKHILVPAYRYELSV